MDLVEILDKIYQKLVKEITEAYEEKRLSEVLKKYGFENEKENNYFAQGNRILVIGQPVVPKEILNGVAKSLGINKNDIDYELDYEKLPSFNFGKLRYTSPYTDILVGPMPHKVKDIENYSSFLSMAEANPEDFPNVIRLETSNELKITKESFRKGLLKTKVCLSSYI